MGEGDFPDGFSTGVAIVGDLGQTDSQSFQAAAHLDHSVLGCLRFKMILGFAKRKLRHLRNLLDGPGREFGVRVDSRAYCRAAQSKLLQTAGSSPDTLDAELDLASIAAEFLAQANRNHVR